MPFNCASKGSEIKAGDKLALQLPVEGPSVLVLEWSCAEELEIALTLNVQPTEGEAQLQSFKPASTMKDEIAVESAGSATLEWTNSNTGWFGGTNCTLSYTVALTSKREIELEEERRKAEAAAEAARLEAERLEAERQKAIEEARLEAERLEAERQKAAEEAQKRKQEREAKLDNLRSSVQKSAADLEAVRELVSDREAEVARLREEFAMKITAAEDSLSSSIEAASSLEMDLVTAEAEIDVLLAEQQREDASLREEEVQKSSATSPLAVSPEEMERYRDIFSEHQKAHSADAGPENGKEGPAVDLDAAAAKEKDESADSKVECAA